MIDQTIKHYRILEHLGGGAMGVVYKAEDTRLKRPVALKFLQPELTSDDTAKNRFIQEAQAASSLEHPNICTIYEIDETDDGKLFIAMAYYEGETLKKRIKRGVLSIDEALDTTIQVARGLGKAHQQGIVHRDIKPANIMLTRDGIIKIVDFGLAKLLGRGGLTVEGATLGTAAYMSPEQAAGEAVDHRSDIWALGVILFEMITGELPFKGDYDQAIRYAIMNEKPQPLTNLRSEAPAGLELIIEKALAKKVDDRYADTNQLIEDLKQVAQHLKPPDDEATVVAGGKTASVSEKTRVNVSSGMESLVGQVVDNYRILEVLGRGGMGIVFKAMDLNLDKLVALKMMDPRFSRDAKFLRRFRSEAKALARLENPHIVMVYALRETEFGFFIVMEYVDSIDLAVKIRNSGPMAPSEALPVFKQLLDALAHAHQAGVIHRDIKPRNVLISEQGLVKVMDFGLAKIQQDSDITATQSVIGTPYYMSPEQVKGLANVTYLSDLYSLGMTFYEMLTGRTPFEKEESDFALLEAIIKRKFPPPSEFNPGIPPALSKIIMKALEKDPKNRFQSAAEMLAAIEQYETDQQKSAARPGAGTRPLRKAPAGSPPEVLPGKKKRRIFLPLLGLVLVLLLAVAVLQPDIRQLLFSGPEERKETVPEQPALIGSLKITSQPSNALVWIDGEQMGRTPYTAGQLTAGAHKLRIEKEGYRSWENAAVQIEAGQAGSLHADLIPRSPQTAPVSEPVATGDLMLQALPRGTVYVDGAEKSADSDEIVRISLPEGQHMVRFQHPQYGSQETSVTVEKNRTRQLICYFENFISVQSLDASEQPLWSTVVINGRDDEELTTPIARYPLPPGQYTITVRRAGYRTVEDVKTIQIRPAFKEIILPLVFHLEKNGANGG